MAKKKATPIPTTQTKHITASKAWKESELIRTFSLTRLKTLTPLMQEWLDAPMPEWNALEKQQFEIVFFRAFHHIEGWNEEDLKMMFIAPVLELGKLIDHTQVVAYFEKTISAKVEDIPLVVKSDFMLAKGIMDSPSEPYFHFQEYKPNKNPTGDSMAQLLEAFLIAQVKNQNGKPLYGVEVVGKQWNFVVMQGKEYCISESYICTKRDDLMQIIAILRKFKAILYERLL
ncbi:MAG: hypothetical protein RLZZ628_739 [Bacteroidota bacterium]|jgi:hypothetical protein